MTSTLPPLTQATTGALGSAAASALTYPLDLLVTRQQTSYVPKVAGEGLKGTRRLAKDALKHGGWSALYNGIETDTAGTLVSNFCYFYAYSFLRGFVLRRRARTSSSPASAIQVLPVPLELLLGFLAGITSRAVSTPLNVLTVQLQTASHEASDDQPKSKRSPLAVIRAIYATSGLSGFWKGFPLAALLSINPAISFALFQAFRRALALLKGGSRTPSPRPGPAEAFAGAALSHALTAWALYPLLLAKTRLQAVPPPSVQRRKEKGKEKEVEEGKGAKAQAEKLVKVVKEAEQWPGGTYQGLEAQLLKAFVSQGVAFLLKERIERGLLMAFGHKQA